MERPALGGDMDTGDELLDGLLELLERDSAASTGPCVSLGVYEAHCGSVGPNLGLPAAESSVNGASGSLSKSTC